MRLVLSISVLVGSVFSQVAFAAPPIQKELQLQTDALLAGKEPASSSVLERLGAQKGGEISIRRAEEVAAWLLGEYPETRDSLSDSGVIRPSNAAVARFRVGWTVWIVQAAPLDERAKQHVLASVLAHEEDREAKRWLVSQIDRELNLTKHLVGSLVRKARTEANAVADLERLKAIKALEALGSSGTLELKEAVRGGLLGLVKWDDARAEQAMVSLVAISNAQERDRLLAGALSDSQRFSPLAQVAALNLIERLKNEGDGSLPPRIYEGLGKALAVNPMLSSDIASVLDGARPGTSCAGALEDLL